MKYKDLRIDSYIEKSQLFAQPILKYLRKQIHKACPEVTETIKWGFPHFEYNGMLCFMASFKEHCTFGFWRGELMKELRMKANISREKGMGQFGRITTLKDLPPDGLLHKWIKEAVNINEKGIETIPKKKITNKKTLPTPGYFSEAINKNKKVAENFIALTASQRNEYVEWVTEAKTVLTRDSRIKSMLEWVKEGKPRNWKYMAKYK